MALAWARRGARGTGVGGSAAADIEIKAWRWLVEQAALAALIDRAPLLLVWTRPRAPFAIRPASAASARRVRDLERATASTKRGQAGAVDAGPPAAHGGLEAVDDDLITRAALGKLEGHRTWSS
ncbi:MAG: hypothetical protein U0470_12355 [Anaerolineae bacterium]